jgi:CubicO group peptidase (beta-lactamase class C family)
MGLRTFTDLLGRGVKVVSGIPFDQCVAERVAKPIALSDTSFDVSAEKAGRIGEPRVDPTANKQPPLIDVTSRPNCLPGRHGLVSTASDYVKLSVMLLNCGECRRICCHRALSQL